MPLSGALQIGRSGLLASQAAIEVAGQNLANVASKGYHRQVAVLKPAGEQELQRGLFLGRGVQVQEILRQVDSALEGRLRGGIADESASQVRKDILDRIESLQNELSDTDLSTQLNQFFNNWSELANTPNDNSLRTVVVQQGASLASFVRNLRSGLTDLRVQVDGDINEAVTSANDLLNRIEGLNDQILRTDRGTGGEHTLRDQRDELLGQLAQYLNISTVERPTGAVDIYVGSLPIMLEGRSRGIDLRTQTANGQTSVGVVLKADGSPLDVHAGKLGALLEARTADVNGAADALDSFANELIYQVNRVHSQGQGAAGFTTLTGTTRVADASATLNSEAAALKFNVGHGSFKVTVTQKSTGQRFTSTVDVDLDGINPAGDTTLASLASSLDGLDRVKASVTGDGRLKLGTDSGDYELSFSDDSSGALAALGINTYFTGSDATDIAVNTLVSQNPGKLAAGQGNIAGDNRNALAMAGLRDQGLSSLGGMTLAESWDKHVEEYAVRSGEADQRLKADGVVRANLEAQQQSVSGVNADEEAIDLLSYQRAYQGSARFLTVVDQMLETLMQLV